MQSVREQLAEALEGVRGKAHLFGDESDNRDAIAGFEHIERLALAALDRHRAEPEERLLTWEQWQAAMQRDPSEALKELGRVRREEGERLRDGK